MSNLVDRGDVFMALNAWFDSQDIDWVDRAFHCAIAAGVYQGRLAQEGRNLHAGIKILNEALTESAVKMHTFDFGDIPKRAGA